MKQLLDLIVSHVEHGFVASMNKNDYVTFVPKELRDKIGPPYSACVQVSVGIAERYRCGMTNTEFTDKPREHIAYHFEEGTTGLGLAIDNTQLLFDELGRSRYRLFFTGGKDLLSLNVADVIAYECGKSWKDFIDPKRSGTIRHPLGTLLSNIPHYFVHLFGPDLGNLETAIMSSLS